jgi:hypothetical protein
VIRTVFTAFALVALSVATEGVALAECTTAVRPATAEEQKFYADSFAQFQRTAPQAPTGWTFTDSVSNGVLKEVCAQPGERVLNASFSRSYGIAETERQARDKDSMAKTNALMEANMAAMKAGKPVDYAAFEAATKKIEADARRDTSAQFVFKTGVDTLNVEGFSSVPVPIGRGYRQEVTSGGVPKQDLIVVLNPAQKSGLKVVQISGDPARVQALLKAATLQ